MKKTGNILSTALLVILFICVATVLVTKMVFGVEMKAVLTGPMEPELPVGSLLFITPVEYARLQVGDDITFIRDKNLTLVTHRVIEKNDEEKTLTTQGIANNTKDKPTGYDNVLGKVSFHIPYVGHLVIWTSTLQGKLIAGFIIVFLMLVSLLFGKKEPKRMKALEKDELNAS